MSLLPLLADRVLNRPQLLLPDKLGIVAMVLDGRIGIDASSLMPDASRFSGNRNHDAGSVYKVEGDVAVVSIVGSLVNRGAWIGASSGLVSYEGIDFQLRTAADDPNVSAIVLDIDSPGGEAIGAFEVAETVRAAAARKPVTAVVNGLCCSAAYAIASAASKIVTTGTGIAGSIGVVMLHVDCSRSLDRAGVTPTFIYAGARKIDGNSFQPLSAGVRSDLQAEIDAFYEAFLATVAKGRPALGKEGARKTEARTYMGVKAVEAGLADAVGTFHSALASARRSPIGVSKPAVPAPPAAPVPPAAKPVSASSMWDRAIERANAGVPGVGAGSAHRDPSASQTPAETPAGSSPWDRAIAKLNARSGSFPGGEVVAPSQRGR